MVFPLPLLRQHAQDSIADLPALKNAAAKVAAHILHGSHGQKKSGGHEKFWQFREFSEADRPQDIDWRQSAKTDHIYVREKELQTPQSVYFWAKRDADMGFHSKGALHSKLEAAQIMSLALAMLFRNGEERIGVLGQGRVGHSEEALDRVGRYLLEHSDSVQPDAPLPSKSSIILCSDFLAPIEEIEASFAPYVGRGVLAIALQVLDPAERDLPYDGHMVFEDAGDAHHKIDNVASIREAYREKITKQLRDVEALCHSYGWTYALHVTDTMPEDTLIKIWEEHQR